LATTLPDFEAEICADIGNPPVGVAGVGLQDRGDPQLVLDFLAEARVSDVTRIVHVALHVGDGLVANDGRSAIAADQVRFAAVRRREAGLEAARKSRRASTHPPASSSWASSNGFRDLASALGSPQLAGVAYIASSGTLAASKWGRSDSERVEVTAGAIPTDRTLGGFSGFLGS
jgi:hypothetical protein